MNVEISNSIFVHTISLLFGNSQQFIIEPAGRSIYRVHMHNTFIFDIVKPRFNVVTVTEHRLLTQVLIVLFEDGPHRLRLVPRLVVAVRTHVPLGMVVATVVARDHVMKRFSDFVQMVEILLVFRSALDRVAGSLHTA